MREQKIMWIHVSVEQSPKEVENEVIENFNFTLIYFVYTEVCIQFDIYYFERRMKRMKKMPLLLQHLFKSCMLILRNCMLKRSRITVQNTWRKCVKDCLLTLSVLEGLRLS